MVTPASEEMQLPWKAVKTATGWELQHASGGWLFELNDRPDRATETDQVFIESQDAIMRFIVTAGNCHHDLLSIAKRWAALDSGGWHPDRCAADKAQLIVDTLAAIAKAEGQS